MFGRDECKGLWHAGGTGLFAVQLAKLSGMHVIGTCGSADKVAMLRTLGVDRVVNYKQEDLKKARTPLEHDTVHSHAVLGLKVPE